MRRRGAEHKRSHIEPRLQREVQAPARCVVAHKAEPVVCPVQLRQVKHLCGKRQISVPIDVGADDRQEWTTRVLG